MTRRLPTFVFLMVALAACSSNEPAPITEPTPTTPAPTVSDDDAWMKLSCGSPVRHLELIERGYYPGRSPDITMTPKEPNLFGGVIKTSHSGPWDYAQDVPLVFYGPGVFAGNGPMRLDRDVTVADAMPTLAELLDVEFPADRPGRPVTEALLPDAEPRLIVFVALDGGGWNVLRTWPKAWPFMKSTMRNGTSITNAVVGSSPSVTPAIHTNMGTGAFPDQHGIVDIWQRRGNITINSYAEMNPRNLRIESFADIYDQALDNEPKVAVVAKDGWHLGMIGHGAALEGGDKDIAVIETIDGVPTTNSDFYELPAYIPGLPGLEEDVATVDAADGEADGEWMDHAVLSTTDLAQVTLSPVRALYQTRQIEAIIEREGFGEDDVVDLLFTNYKTIDVVGHVYNHASPEEESTIQHTDAALESLAGFLDETVGEERWGMVLTADHGQGPAPRDTGGWPLDVVRLMRYTEEALGFEEGTLFDKWRPTGFWLRREIENKKEVAADISNLLAEYTARDDIQGREIPESFTGDLREPVFESAFPMDRIADVIECARTRDASG